MWSAERCFVGPFAVWSPTPLGAGHRWAGVRRGDPQTHVVVVTAPAGSDVCDLFADDGTDGADWFEEVGREADVRWAARRAHPGLPLSALLARDPRGTPPPEFLVAVVRALTRGGRAARAVDGADDVNVGVDGVVTIDGLDDQRDAALSIWRAPTLDDRRASLALSSRILCDVGGVSLADLLERTHATEAGRLDVEQRFAAGIVAGLAPDVVERERERADERALLGERAWRSWSTLEGTRRVFGDVLDDDAIDRLRASAAELSPSGLESLDGVLLLFSRLAIDRVSTIEDAWRSQRPRKVTRATQVLVEAATMLGVAQVGRLARDVERRATGPFDAALVERLRAAVSTALAALRAICGAPSTPSGAA